QLRGYLLYWEKTELLGSNRRIVNRSHKQTPCDPSQGALCYTAGRRDYRRLVLANSVAELRQKVILGILAVTLKCFGGNRRRGLVHDFILGKLGAFGSLLLLARRGYRLG